MTGIVPVGVSPSRHSHRQYVPAGPTAGFVRRAFGAALVVAVCVGHTHVVSAQPVASLFVDVPRAAAVRVTVRPEHVRSRRMSIRTDLLAAALAPGANAQAPFVLNLFPDVVLTLVRERLESDARGYTTWVGSTPGEPDSVASLTWNGRTLVGGVVARGVAFDLETVVDGVVSVSQRASTALPVELTPVTPAPADRAQLASPSLSVTAGDAATAQIDVLVLYTPAARLKAGGDTLIQSQLANAVAVTNTAFQRSGVNAVLRAVGVQELAHAESIDLGGDLSAISLGGQLSTTVEAARNAAGADLVTLVTGRASSSSGCGLAWMGPSSSAAYSVTEQACLYAGQWSFSHELGHNFGADHAPGDSSAAGVPYARGYRDGSVRTLMAYAVYGSPSRVLNYSSATVLEPAAGGLPTGNSLQNNARRLSETVAWVSAYRGTTGGAGPPSAPTGLAANASGPVVTLSWLAAPGATSYLVQGGVAPGDSSAFSFTESGVSLVGSLPPGTYSWRVHAQNSSGTGAPSAESSVTVLPSATVPPSAPTAFVASVVGSTVSLSWSPTLAGGPVSSFELEGGPSPGSSAFGRLAVAQSPLVVPNVSSGTFYLRVRALGPGGASAPSPDAVVRVGASASCIGPGISALTSAVTGGAVTLDWTTPSGTGPFAYTLAVGRSAGASNLGVYPMGAVRAVSATPPRGTYFVRVVASNTCGVGAASPDVVVVIP